MEINNIKYSCISISPYVEMYTAAHSVCHQYVYMCLCGFLLAIVRLCSYLGSLAQFHVESNVHVSRQRLSSGIEISLVKMQFCSCQTTQE